MLAWAKDKKAMISCQKDFFEIPKDIAYLNCSYFSPMMKTVKEAGMLGVNRKARPWEILPNHYFDEAEDVRKRCAELIGASSDDIALIPACSYGLAVAAKNLKVGKGDEIVVLAEQFPSNVYAWWELAQSSGAKIKTVERQNGMSWAESVLALLSPKTKIIAIPNVHWADGSLVDAETIGSECRRLGVDLVLDVTQSLGAYPFSVKKVQPSFMACAGYKWLLAPYTTSFLYVSPEHQQGKPLENSWLTRKGSEDFAALVHYEPEYQPGARRFDMGERSNFALLPMLNAALQQILKWTVPEIHDTISAKTNYLADAFMDLGLKVIPKKERAGHILGVRFPKGLPAGLLDTLAKHQVFVSVRGNAVRISPHIYNSDDDLAKAIEAIEDVLSAG